MKHTLFAVLLLASASVFALDDDAPLPFDTHMPPTALQQAETGAAPKPDTVLVQQRVCKKVRGKKRCHSENRRVLRRATAETDHAAPVGRTVCKKVRSKRRCSSISTGNKSSAKKAVKTSHKQARRSSRAKKRR